jgi:hypothetical protein
MPEMNNDAIARIEEQVKALAHSNDKILRGIYGNGVKGLKERVKELETKFWIVFVLMLPMACYAIKELIFG